MVASIEKAKISSYKLDKILRGFVLDYTVTETWLAMKDNARPSFVSKKTVGKKYELFRRLLISGSFVHPELFGGSGSVLCVGMPPSAVLDLANDSRFQICDDGRKKVNIKRYQITSPYLLNKHLYFWMERVLRTCMYRKLSLIEAWAVLDFSIIKFLKRKNKGEIQGLDDWGISYVAEINWSSQGFDYGLRETELWKHIFFRDAISFEAYCDSFFRGMKLLLRKYPEGIVKKRMPRDYVPSQKEIQNQGLIWFPEGYERND